LGLAWSRESGCGHLGMNGGWEDAGTGVVRQESDQLRGLREDMDIAMSDRLRDTRIAGISLLSISCEYSSSLR